jgi:hypothetical protein
MKTALLALTGAFMISGAALADAANVKESYVAGAFSSVDDDWLRITVNRHGDCGEYGSSGYRRVDVLIARYNAIGEAIESGDDAEVKSAAQAFASLLDANTRFESCWDEIARKEGIKSGFKRQVAKV